MLFWGTSSGNYGDNSGNIDKSQTTYTVPGLSEGTAYYFAVKAYDDQGRESEYSNEVETSGTQIIPDGSSSTVDDGGCFIATAVFGSKMDGHVEILCTFRDNRLLTNQFGRGIVNLYYRLSPPAADYLKQHPFARVVVKYTLIPITGVAYLALYVHSVALSFGFFLLLLTGLYCVA